VFSKERVCPVFKDLLTTAVEEKSRYVSAKLVQQFGKKITLFFLKVVYRLCFTQSEHCLSGTTCQLPQGCHGWMNIASNQCLEKLTTA